MPLTRLLLRLLLGASLLAPGLAGGACVVSLRWDNDPPYSMQLADGAIVGIAVDSARSVLHELGCEVRMVRLPWGRALRELEQGRLDVLSGAFRKPEREVYAYFSGVVAVPSRNILFMSRQANDRWPVSELLQLRETSFRLGAQIGVAYGEDYQTLIQVPAFRERMAFSASRTSLWRMLGKGRLDGVIANEYTGQQELVALGLSEVIGATPVVVSSEGAEVAFSKKSVSPEFVQRYAAALRRQIAEGEYERIRARYLQP